MKARRGCCRGGVRSHAFEVTGGESSFCSGMEFAERAIKKWKKWVKTPGDDESGMEEGLAFG